MDAVKICDYCEKLADETTFDKTHRMCPDCREAFLAVRKLVEAHPNISVFEVSRKTGVTVKKIRSFAARGWFLVGEGSPEWLNE